MSGEKSSALGPILTEYRYVSRTISHYGPATLPRKVARRLSHAVVVHFVGL